jgi:MFS family permease
VSIFGGITATLMSSYLPVALAELLPVSLKQNADETSAVINSAYLFGMMTGGLLIGFLSDRFGRKPGVQISIAFIGTFTLLTSFVQGWQLLGVLRFLTGLGVGGILVATTILVAEEWPEKSRNVALGILSVTIPIGIFAAGLITYFISNWRSGFLVGSIPLFLGIASQFFLRESIHWKKQAQEKKPGKVSLFHRSLAFDLFIGCTVYGSMLIGLWAIFSWLPTWVQTLVTNSDGQQERGLSMMLFATGGLLGGFISGWVSNLIGVKRALLLCFAAVFTLSFILFKLNHALTVFSYIQMAGIAFFFGMSQGVLNVYIPELFPTEVRSSATGFCFNIGRTFTAAAVFFVGWLVEILGGYGNALFLFSFVFLVGFIAMFFAREKNLIKS